MEILILVFLILLNGAFAMSEVALLTARKPRLAALAKRGDALAAAAVKLSEEPTRFLSTVQIGITSIGLLSGIFGEAVLAAPLAHWLQSLGLEERMSGWAATALVVVCITYASIVLGELDPSGWGSTMPKRSPGSRPGRCARSRRSRGRSCTCCRHPPTPSSSRC